MNLQNYVGEIWKKYDLDNNGTLNKEEFTMFINECATLLGNDKQGLSSLQEKLKNLNIEQAFNLSDKDGSGGITRTEMFTFLNTLCGQEDMDVEVT